MVTQISSLTITPCCTAHRFKSVCISWYWSPQQKQPPKWTVWISLLQVQCLNCHYTQNPWSTNKLITRMITLAIWNAFNWACNGELWHEHCSCGRISSSSYWIGPRRESLTGSSLKHTRSILKPLASVPPSF